MTRKEELQCLPRGLVLRQRVERRVKCVGRLCGHVAFVIYCAGYTVSVQAEAQ